MNRTTLSLGNVGKNLSCCFLLGIVLNLFTCPALSDDLQDQLVPVGVAKIDIIPDYSIRLSGYASRQGESEGVYQQIWAKALAIGRDDAPVILITVDNCGVPASVSDDVAARIGKKTGLPRRQIAICSSHTHCAPMLTGVLPLLYGEPIPQQQQAKIDRYTRELTDKLVDVSLAALAQRKPAHISWAVGEVQFAINRRRKTIAPVDHTLPMLKVTDPKGNIRAILVRYACHATTVFGDFNQICGDWPGYAQSAIEREFPDAIALVSIGCGADAKPNTQRKIEHARQHGEEIAGEVKRLIRQNRFRPIEGKITAKMEEVELPFAPLPTHQEWIKRSASKHKQTAYHAKVNLQRLDRGEQLPGSIKLPIQAWLFDDDLAMLFLGGEVVVDYQLRLNRLFDASRIWVNAYSNDVPCYITSERLLKEGGYEPERSMIYYDRPTKFETGIEDRIINTVSHLLPTSYHSPRK